MFSGAMEAIRSGRSRSDQRAALRRDLRAQEDEELDQELEELTAAINAERESAEAEESANREAAIKELNADLRKRAREIDAALISIGSAYEDMERAATELSTLRGSSRSSGVMLLRHNMLNAMWLHCRPLCKRLRLAITPGSSRRWRSLADAFQDERG